MKSVIEGGILFAGALLIATGAWAQAATNKPVDVKNDWSIFKAANPTECWGASSPKKWVAMRGGKEVKANRGPIMLFVTFRPGAGANGEISFTGGYPFAKNSTAEMELNGKKYELFTQGEWAWPRTPADGSGLLAALKGGSEATITAHSDRGTETKDTFSLMGFTAAMAEAEKICAK
ncbi:MAG: hypothetical protein KGI94_13065 [Paracoccaceae bacterium]|nr:hypothetical protein [Paracoccaceae bacterium]MDE3120477.1 hypothetical protein [Paracoccaceae bacterium]MDE3238177.1 hypothetical protein [Paracoccaceae bacterium]